MKSSLRARLLISYLAITLLVLATVDLLAITFLQRATLEQRQRDLVAHARVVADVSTSYIIKGHDYLEAIARDYGQRVGARVVILNAAGVVLRDSFVDPAMQGRDLLDRPDVVHALGGHESIHLEQVAGVGRTLYAAVPITYGGRVAGVVLLAQGAEGIWADLAQTTRILLAVSLAALLLALLVGLALAARLVRPVTLVTAGVRAVEAGDLSRRVAVSQPDELGQLAAAFNGMAARLERAESSRRAFVANAAHELRTPLAALKALVEPLLSGAVTAEAERAEFLQDMGQEVDRLSDLAQDLLTLSQLESNQPLRLEPVDLAGLLARVRTRLSPLAREVQVMLPPPESPELVLRADALKLERALYNLVHNAITFSPPGGSVTLRAARTDGGVQVAVRDQGPGIAPADQAHLFERFYRSERSRSRERGGAGLGLAIAREIVQRHGGRIWLESTLEEGSCFVFELPVALG